MCKIWAKTAQENCMHSNTLLLRPQDLCQIIVQTWFCLKTHLGRFPSAVQLNQIQFLVMVYEVTPLDDVVAATVHHPSCILPETVCVRNLSQHRHWSPCGFHLNSQNLIKLRRKSFHFAKSLMKTTVQETKNSMSYRSLTQIFTVTGFLFPLPVSSCLLISSNSVFHYVLFSGNTKSTAEAINLVDDLKKFASAQLQDELLVAAISKVSQRLEETRLSQQRQSAITDFYTVSI